MSNVETLEPEVKILSLAIKSPGRPDIFLPIPENGNPKGLWFTLKEGSRYSLKFTFQVSNNIVSGLKYTNTVWKTGMKGKLSVSLSLMHTNSWTSKESGHIPLGFNFFLSCESLYQLTAQKRCLEPSVLRQSLTHMRCLKRLHRLAYLPEDRTQLEVRLVQPMFYVAFSLWFTLIIPNNLRETLYHETRIRPCLFVFLFFVFCFMFSRQKH